METAEIKRIDKAHIIHPWSIHGALDPLVFDHGEGACFWDKNGKRYIDFVSQLINQNTGFQHPRVVKAIRDQVEKCCFTSPDFAYESRSELADALRKITPGDLDHFFFTLSGAESNEYAMRMARQYTGKFKILSRYRSYHGGTAGALTLSGEPRRVLTEPGVPGILHVLDPFCYYCSFNLTYPDCGVQCAKHIEEIIRYENPETVAAIIFECIPGSNGIFVPPPEYIPMVRDICDRYDILMVCDEVMTGFGRTGRWFAVEHWNVVPDILTMSKGITSGYVPLGCVAVSRKIWNYFQDHMLWCGLTCNTHPLACAAAVETMKVYKEEGLIEKARSLGTRLKKELEKLKAKHPSIGDVRGLGLFNMIDLARDRQSHEPLIPWNAAGDDLALSKEIGKRLLDKGLYTTVRWSWIFVAPPLVITESQLEEALEILDDVLDFVDTKVS